MFHIKAGYQPILTSYDYNAPIGEAGCDFPSFLLHFTSLSLHIVSFTSHMYIIGSTRSAPTAVMFTQRSRQRL